MNNRAIRLIGLVAWIFGAVVGSAHAAEPLPEKVDFNRDIRPILTKKCFKCHGPGAKNSQTDLRFDRKANAFQDLGGYRAIVPGKPGASELYKRITADDPANRMPPADSGKTLTDREVKLFKRWIKQGAPWEKQWALIPPERPTPPEVDREDWPRNPIDYFVLDKLEDKGLTPSSAADKRTLLRRVTLDLTGLPPTPAELHAFLADGSPAAYRRAVDRLLASPRYGEHQARRSLDAVRYADTHGMHFDNKRSMWPYRDWVIEAYNENMPFDRFTVEQLAGDLLPNPTREQLVASGYNRCNITSNEGGSINEELRVRYTKDRAIVTGTNWLGLTLGCAQCHDHKYDPIGQKEFYRFYAFFKSIADNARDGNALLPPPAIEVPSPRQERKLEEVNAKISKVRKKIDKKVDAVDYQPAEASSDGGPQRKPYVWIDDALPKGANPQVGGGKPKKWAFIGESEGPVLSGQRSTRRKADGKAQHYFEGADDKLVIGKGDTLFAYVWLDPKDPPKEIMLQFNDGKWGHRAVWGEDRIGFGKKGTPSRRMMGELPEPGKWVRLEVPAKKVGLEPGDKLNGWAFTQYGGTVYWDKAGVVTKTPQSGGTFDSLIAWARAQRSTDSSSLPKSIREIVKKDRGDRSDAEKDRLRDYFVEHAYSKTRSTFAPLHRQMKALKREKKELKRSIPGTMIARTLPEGKKRQSHVLIRGMYDRKGEPVEPGVPSMLHDWPEDAPRNRLGLAKWLVDSDNPLTPRVIVNRLWQECFGRGIVKTSENFGALGEKPTHPKLLDWLAVEFVESGWDVKHMFRLIVRSATYQQASQVSPDLRKRDPNNKWLARGPHHRLDAEAIRDYALAVSGLLVDRIGGPPVNPYQPKGLWKAVAYESSNTRKFVRDDGAKLYRRSLYTFWKRTSPPPNMTAFDAPKRTSCQVRRSRTNTPLQALVLMDDVQFVEAARKLGERIVREGGETAKEKIRYAFEVVLGRLPSAKEMELMLQEHRSQRARYKDDPSAAKKLIRRGEAPVAEELDPVRLATWTMVGHVLLNLSETITKG